LRLLCLAARVGRRRGVTLGAALLEDRQHLLLEVDLAGRRLLSLGLVALTLVTLTLVLGAEHSGEAEQERGNEDGDSVHGGAGYKVRSQRVLRPRNRRLRSSLARRPERPQARCCRSDLLARALRELWQEREGAHAKSSSIGSPLSATLNGRPLGEVTTRSSGSPIAAAMVGVESWIGDRPSPTSRASGSVLP